MKPGWRLCCILSIVALAPLAGGCSSYQWQETGKNLGSAAAGQLFILAVSGMDGLEEYNDRKMEKWQRENDPYRSSLTVEELIESQKRAEQWERYDDIVRERQKAAKLAIPGESADDRLVCPPPAADGRICY